MSQQVHAPILLPQPRPQGATTPYPRKSPRKPRWIWLDQTKSALTRTENFISQKYQAGEAKVTAFAEASTNKLKEGAVFVRDQSRKMAGSYSQNVITSWSEMKRHDPITANKLALGLLASVISGDIRDKQLSYSFDEKGPAVVTINGVKNTQDDALAMNADINRSIRIEQSAMIVNETHGAGIQDFLQVAMHEYTGAIDVPAVHAAAAIKQGIKEKGEVYVVAHSQGSAVFRAALELLTSDERSKIHYLGLGPEKKINAEALGLADAKNVWNKGDVVPAMGNIYRPSAWFMPSDWSRKIGESWSGINRPLPGNSHQFIKFYSQEVKKWAKEQGIRK